MLGIVSDARHDFRAAEALRILERSVGNQFAAFKIDQTQDNRRGAQIHGDAVDGAGGTIDFDAVDEDAVAIARDCGIELQSCFCSPGSPKRLALDAHVAASHGVAAHFAVSRL